MASVEQHHRVGRAFLSEYHLCWWKRRALSAKIPYTFSSCATRRAAHNPEDYDLKKFAVFQGQYRPD